MSKMSFQAPSLTRNLRQRRWLVGLFVVFLVSLLVVNNLIISQVQIFPFGNTTNQVLGNYVETKEATAYPATTTVLPPVQKGYVVSNRGCRIPDLRPWEPTALRYFDKIKPIVCEYGSHLPLVNSNASAIFVDPEARPHYYNDSEPVDCCWRTFWRTPKRDNKVTYSQDCHPFEDVAYINDEFVRVECQGKNGTVYHDYFAFVPRKLHVEARCRKQLRLDRLLSKNKNSTADGRKLSVLMVGVDSVSRLNFHRLMPRSLGILKELGATELYGYNKVADNTYPNLVPVLSGHSVAEFEKLCWTNHDEPFDKCPFIWKNFSVRGYRTIFGEDACWMSIFNYVKPGFSKPPTDYYLRPACYESESMIGNSHKYNAKLCVGTRLAFENLLSYARKAADEFADDPYFGLFWQASLTHDDIEYPQLGDDGFHDFLAYLRDNELLRNTALIFMSDHGMRWGSFRQTYQGRFEDSLPFVFLLLPDWWKQQHPRAYRNLQANTRSLTSPYDLHETLMDILEPARMTVPTAAKAESNDIPNTTEESSPSVGPTARDISLFGAIPDDRSCDSAGIPEHWCMCQVRYDASLDDPVVPRVLTFLRDEINGMLARHPQCSKLNISRLIDAKVVSHNPTSGLSTDGSSVTSTSTTTTTERSFQPFWTDYSLTVEMIPGGAIFEGSVRYRADNDSMSLVDSVSRLNAYGNQSSCVDDFHMRLYCYCHH